MASRRMTWGEVYQANLNRGYDHGYAAFRADENEKKHMRELDRLTRSSVSLEEKSNGE